MNARVLIVLALVTSGCDVEASLGAHDTGAPDTSTPDAAPFDAFVPVDAWHELDAGTDGGVDAWHEPIDAGDDAGLDAGSDAATACHAVVDAGACGECTAMACCAEQMACDVSATCPCIMDCVFTGHAVDGCVTHCGADHGEHTTLLDCQHAHCTGLCP